MPKLEPAQRAKLAAFYFLNGKSPRRALRAYGHETGDYEPCSRNLVKKYADQFVRTGTMHRDRGRPGTSDDAIVEIAIAAMEIAQGNVYGDTSPKNRKTTT